MSFVRRLFSRAYRRARRAEGKGDYREAAALYAEAGANEAAANALLFDAARAPDVDGRVNAYRDALRWLPADHPRRAEVEAQIGLAILDDAQRRGARTAEERRRLTDAAERLERANRDSDAATAWEILGRTDEMARCLERAGEVERLEKLLVSTQKEDQQERKVRGFVRDYEMALAGGARREARAALRNAVDAAPDDPAVADLLRRLEARWLSPKRAELRVGDRTVWLVGALPMSLGRDADVPLRGASVSRRHTEVGLRDGRLVVTDLDSRNGTLLRGVPLAGEMLVEGETELGLGDDVTVTLSIAGRALVLDVVHGLDRGCRALAGEGGMRVPGLAAELRFDGGHAIVAPDPGSRAELGHQRIVAPVELLRDDTITVDGVVVEVVG